MSFQSSFPFFSLATELKLISALIVILTHRNSGYLKLAFRFLNGLFSCAHAVHITAPSILIMFNLFEIMPQEVGFDVT